MKKHVPLNSEYERDILAEGLNLVIEKYRDSDNQQIKAKRASTLRRRLPGPDAFEVEDGVPGGQPPAFFKDSETTFSRLTEYAFLGTRATDGLKVARRFSINPKRASVRITEKYYVADYLAKEVEREVSGNVRDIDRDSPSPLDGATIKGVDAESYCRQVHDDSERRDDSQVRMLLYENPYLYPYIGKQLDIEIPDRLESDENESRGGQ